MTPGEYRTKYAQNGIWPGDCDHGVYHAGCGEPPVTAPRNCVPIVKSTCPRVRNRANQHGGSIQ